MKAFISYSTKYDNISKEIKYFLSTLNIDSFVASEDLRTSSNWKHEIIKNLRDSKIFIPLLSKEFKDSNWCSQEMGIAYIRKLKIIPLSIDETKPYGFISDIQSKSITANDKELVILEGLMEYKIQNGIDGVLNKLEESGTYRYSEELFKIFGKYLEKLSGNDLNRVIKICIQNSQIWNASECQKHYLPSLIKKRNNDIQPDLLQKIEYQITQGTWYKENDV